MAEGGKWRAPCGLSYAALSSQRFRNRRRMRASCRSRRASCGACRHAVVANVCLPADPRSLLLLHVAGQWYCAVSGMGERLPGLQIHEQ